MTRHLLRLVLTSREGVRAAAGDAFRAASEASWQAFMVRLDEHRLLPLAYYTLAQHGLLPCAPAAVSSALKAQHDYCQMVNGLALLTLHGVSVRFRQLGIETVACKGCVLAAHYYPNAGMRWMNDVDLWIPGPDGARAHEALEALGFRRLPEKSLPDGENFQNAMGITLDVHTRMRLFEQQPGGYLALTELAPSSAFRVFQPNALLAYLCAHMAGHLAETGPMLCWVIDLGFVIQKHGDDFDVARLRQLLSPNELPLLLRLLRFLESELDFSLPPRLSAVVRGVPPLRLATLLRLRRLSLWQLPRPKGWVRLLACALRMRSAGGRPWPSIEDLALWPRDHAEQWWEAHKPAFSQSPLRDAAE